VVSVRLLDELGLARAGEFAEAAGIATPLTDNLTAALGSTEIPVMELVNAYATIASGGSVHAPVLVSHVTDTSGEIVLSNPYQPRQAMDPALAYVLTSLMTSVIERGTGRAARALGRPAAGKTGTTNDARDAWFVGFVPQLVAGGWVGFDDYRPLGRREYGGRAALPMWLHFMQTVLADEEIEEFHRPDEGVVTRRIDPATGLLAQPDAEDYVDEMFIEGTDPTRYAPERAVGPIDRVLLQTPTDVEEELPRRQYDDF
jgi:penicillin-binding protein 1A